MALFKQMRTPKARKNSNSQAKMRMHLSSENPVNILYSWTEHEACPSWDIKITPSVFWRNCNSFYFCQQIPVQPWANDSRCLVLNAWIWPKPQRTVQIYGTFHWHDHRFECVTFSIYDFLKQCMFMPTSHNLINKNLYNRHESISSMYGIFLHYNMWILSWKCEIVWNLILKKFFMRTKILLYYVIIDFIESI